MRELRESPGRRQASMAATESDASSEVSEVESISSSPYTDDDDGGDDPYFGDPLPLHLRQDVVADHDQADDDFR